MNKLFLNFLMISVFLFSATVFTSCGGDDDDPVPAKEKTAEFLVGVYEGEVSTAKGKANVKMEVKSTGDNTIEVSFVESAPFGVMEKVATELMSVGEKEIWGSEPTIVHIIYVKSARHLTCQYTGGPDSKNYSFKGIKK